MKLMSLSCILILPLVVAADPSQSIRAAEDDRGPPQSLRAAAHACLLQARVNQLHLGSRSGLSGPQLDIEYNFSSRVAKTLVTIAPCETRTPPSLPTYWHCPDRSAKVVTCLTYAREGGIETVLSDSRVRPARSLRDFEIESIQMIPPESELSLQEWSFGPLGNWIRAEIDPLNQFHILESGSLWSDTRSTTR